MIETVKSCVKSQRHQNQLSINFHTEEKVKAPNKQKKKRSRFFNGHFHVHQATLTSIVFNWQIKLTNK